jgi:hypothetical protein
MPFRLDFSVLKVDVPRGREGETLVLEIGDLPVKIG